MYQFCVSGAAKGETVEEGQEMAEAIGKELAKRGHTLLTGATIGLPNFAATAYKKADGKMSLGLSPASSKVEHVFKYRLPTLAYDCILYTGLHYVGRDTLLITSADAVISIGGRIGTLHEFSIAIEADTPIGLLHGGGGVSDEIKTILSISKPVKDSDQVIFSNSASDLLDKLTTLLNSNHSKYRGLYN